MQESFETSRSPSRRAGVPSRRARVHRKSIETSRSPSRRGEGHRDEQESEEKATRLDRMQRCRDCGATRHATTERRTERVASRFPATLAGRTAEPSLRRMPPTWKAAVAMMPAGMRKRIKTTQQRQSVQPRLGGEPSEERFPGWSSSRSSSGGKHPQQTTMMGSRRRQAGSILRACGVFENSPRVRHWKICL